MTTPYGPYGLYSPATAQALAAGASDADWVEKSGVDWDGPVASYNNRAITERNDILALDLRDNLAAHRRDQNIPSIGTVRILAGGDSITAGYGSLDGGGYQAWLTDILARRHITAQITTVAEPSRTLRYMAPLILAALPTAQPDVVLINLGTNCAGQNDLADWQARMGTFVDQILASSPTVKVAVARIALSRPQALAAAEATINTYVDAVVAARRPSGRVVSADMVAAVPHRWCDIEGIHPTDPGYLRMAQQWTAAINPWLPTP
jgi:lysophospholipase L1-like esterase